MYYYDIPMRLFKLFCVNPNTSAVLHLTSKVLEQTLPAPLLNCLLDPMQKIPNHLSIRQLRGVSWKPGRGQEYPCGMPTIRLRTKVNFKDITI